MICPSTVSPICSRASCLGEQNEWYLTYAAVALQELELLESRSQGIKTKAETQAKYGW